MASIDYTVLTKAQLCDLARDRLALSRECRKTKEGVLQHILDHGDEALRHELGVLAQEQAARKRPRAEVQHERRVAQRIEEERSSRRDPSKYLQLPSEGERRACHREFLCATSNASLALRVCGICAREVGEIDDRVELTLLSSIEHRARLHPVETLPMHDLYEGCLLEPAGVVCTAGETSVRTCRECREDLKHDVPSPPALSLANNLWIGRVPAELCILTVPEQLLVAQLYPRVYVFKLFPKTPGYRPPTETLQRGMRGTVSTYELDTQGVVNMTEGNLMPRLPEVLAKVISVTFVGVGALPKKWLRTTFRVRRHVVHAALSWLRANHRHYGDIVISEDRLRALPEDDVPEELLGVVRQCSDPGVTLQEGSGYVPEDDDEVPGATADPVQSDLSQAAAAVSAAAQPHTHAMRPPDMPDPSPMDIDDDDDTGGQSCSSELCEVTYQMSRSPRCHPPADLRQHRHRSQSHECERDDALGTEQPVEQFRGRRLLGATWPTTRQ